jgi:hypothetical protein
VCRVSAVNYVEAAILADNRGEAMRDASDTLTNEMALGDHRFARADVAAPSAVPAGCDGLDKAVACQEDDAAVGAPASPVPAAAGPGSCAWRGRECCRRQSSPGLALRQRWRAPRSGTIPRPTDQKAAP